MKKNWNNWNLLFTNLSTGKTFLVTNTYNILHGGKNLLDSIDNAGHSKHHHNPCMGGASVKTIFKINYLGK
jgi:hypothetical protein